MSADALLSYLDGVKRTGPDRWIAKCPAHEDRRASLSIREAGDDKILVHCFAGCAASDVVTAVGLELTDLFPPRTDTHAVKGERRPFPAADILRGLSTEITIVVVYASDLRAGRIPSHQDHQRFLLAVTRIIEADSDGKR